MSYQRWNTLVLCLVIFVSIGTVAFDYELNFYGIFGNVAGRRYLIYDNERTTKYLFSYNYIPNNFDSLLIGTSISDNWDTGSLTGVRMYNVSLSGGNITEEALVVDKILEEAKPKFVVFLIYPFLTESHGRQTGYMYPKEYWAALGSVQLFRAYGRRWLIKKGYVTMPFNAFGQWNFDSTQITPHVRELINHPHSSFFVDPQAFKDYSDLLERVRASGAKVIGVFPPIRTDLWQRDRTAFTQYYSTMRPLFRRDEPVIDMNKAEFDDFKQPTNFQDGVHYTQAAAEKIVAVLGERLKTVASPLEAQSLP